MTRTPPEVPAKRPRNVFSDDRARWFRGFAWGAFPGTFIGVVVLAKYGVVAGIAVFLLFTLGVGGVAIAVSETVGEMVRGVTDGKARPSPGTHSRADALLVRGDAKAAVDVLRASLEQFPDDPDAWLRIARIQRDEFERPREALVAFRRGRATGACTTAQMRLTMREMLETAGGLGQRHLVSADLEAHRDAFEGTEEAAWATRELDELSRPGDASAS